MASTVSIENASFYGELEKGVGVKFLSVMDQGTMSYSRAIDGVMAQEGNKQTMLAKQMSTDQGIVHMLMKTGTNYPQVFAEGAAIPSDSRLIGYKTSIAPQYKGSSIIVTMKAIKDREYNSQLDEAKDLSMAMIEAQDRDFFYMFNNAFIAQASLPLNTVGYGDGKPLCSTLHPRIDGGTAQSNASATGLVLNGDNFETARIALMRQLDDRGKPINVGSGSLLLLVPPENEKIGTEIAKSHKKVNTGNNNINVYEGLFTVVSSKWLAETGSNLATTGWFVIDTKVAKLYFLLREAAQTHMATDANTLNKTFYIFSRYAICWGDWRGVWGSKGDGAAYSS